MRSLAFALTLSATPALADVSCHSVADTLQLCVENREFIVLQPNDTGRLTIADPLQGVSVIFEVPDDGYSTAANYAEGIGALSNAKPLPETNSGNLQRISWQMTSTVEGAVTMISPAVVTWVGNAKDGVVVETVFPNKFNLPDQQILSDAQLEMHQALVARIQETNQ